MNCRKHSRASVNDSAPRTPACSRSTTQAAWAQGDNRFSQLVPPAPLPGGRGKRRAPVAVSNSLLIIAWHLLPDPGTRFTGLGPGWHGRPARYGANTGSSPNPNGHPA